VTDLSASVLAALALGLLGGGHCLGMCGGLMGALSLGIPPEQKKRRFSLLLACNLGRALSYSAAGLLLGFGGQALAGGSAATALRLLAALLLLGMGLYLAGWWSFLPKIERLGAGLWRRIAPLTQRLLPIRSIPRALLLGALWGWLPCGLVYSTLLWSASQGSAAKSALLMLAFALGTWPVLLASALAAQQLSSVLRRTGIRRASGLLIILFGLWSLPGPHQHWLMGH